MPKFKVHICRISYSHLDIDVEAEDEDEASLKAIDDAGNHTFPNENASDYTSEGVRRL
jgi:hypothetical protein